MTLPTLALRNVLRRPGRAAASAAAVALAVVALVVVRTAVGAWEATWATASSERLGTRHRVSFTLPLPRAYADEVRRVPGVAAASFATFFAGRDPRSPRRNFTSLAVDAPSYLGVYDEIALEPAARARFLAERDGAVLGEGLARSLGVAAGDTLTLAGTIYPGSWRFEISGVFTAPAGSPLASQLLFHWARLDEAVPAWRRGRIGWIVTRPAGDPASVAAAIDAAFAGRDVRTATTTERSIQRSFSGLLASVLGALDAVTLALLAVVGLLVGNAVAMGVRGRQAEYVVLHSLGFSRARIAGLLACEGLYQGLAGGLLGVAAGALVARLALAPWIRVNVPGLLPGFEVSAATAVLGGVAPVLAGTLASVALVRRLLRGPIASSLRSLGE